MGDFKKSFGGDKHRGGGTFNRGPGGRPGFGGGDRGGDRADRPMYKAVCAECSKPTEVPFRPSGDRPVYCRDCFAAMGPQDRDSRGPSAPRRDFAPSARPSFTPRPFSPSPQQGSGEDKRLDDMKIQLATVISKLDKLVNIMVNSPAAPASKKSESKSETLQETIAQVAPKAKATPKKKSASKKK